MPVRLTERRIPNAFQASDLGQAVPSSDGRCVVVSFITDPLVINRPNVYVLFVTDAGLASSAQNFEWAFTENTNPAVILGTDEGEASYTPSNAGQLSVRMRALGAGNTELTVVNFTQSVVSPNTELEQLIETASTESGPGIGNPAVVRELINDYNPYYQAATLQAPESGDSFKCFLFSTAYDGLLRQSYVRRMQHSNQLAASLNNNVGDYAELAAEGIGVCGVRLPLLAMTLGASPLIPWTELPQAPAARSSAELALANLIRGLDENTKVDMFNLLRFPKSNIIQCGRILESLRNRYFGGANFTDVLNGMSGTRAEWITRHLREGPVLRA